MRDIAAVPHRADDVGGLRSGRLLEALRDRGRQQIAGKECGAVTVIEMRQHQIIGDEAATKSANTAAQSAPMRASRTRSSAAGANITIQSPRNSQSGKPHIALRAAAGDELKREQCERRTERQQRDDAAVESVGVVPRAAAFAAGQNNGAAISSEGMRKKAWPPRYSAGLRR